MQIYPQSDILQMIHYEGNSNRQFVQGEGCKKCYDTGHQGRLGVYEVLNCSHKMREVISQTPNLDLIRQTHLEEGGTTLLKEGIKRAEEGMTSLNEVISVAHFE